MIASYLEKRTVAVRNDAKHTVFSRYFLCLFSALILFGCAGRQISEMEITTETVDYPELGIVVTKGIGERLVAKGTRITASALEVVEATQFGKKEHESSVLTCAKTVMPGSWFKQGVYESEASQADCFGPVKFRATLVDGTTNVYSCDGTERTGEICRDNDGKYFLDFTSMLAPRDTKSYLQQDFEHVRLIKKVVESKFNFVQDLIYNGRVGGKLYFTYRAFSDDIYHPFFTEDIQYDYSEPSIIEFKDLQIEIIGATNNLVTYMVIHNF